METRRELATEQLRLMEVIRVKSNINVVTCGHCGSILLHEMKSINEENDIVCYDCKSELDLCDCPDLWYEGCIENMEFDEDINPPKLISTIDVVNVAIELKMDLSIGQVNEVLRLYPDEVKENPDWNWSEIVENIIYNII